MHIGRLGVPAQRIGESSQERREAVKRTEHAGFAACPDFCRSAATGESFRPDDPIDATVRKLY